MHIVNDKKPGILIVVMAGAKGIKGEKIPLMVFRFMVNQSLKSETRTNLKISDAQLMSDKLKEITYTTRLEPITISVSGAFQESTKK